MKLTTQQIASLARKRVSKMNRKQRDDLFEKGMQIIYGSKKGVMRNGNRPNSRWRRQS